VLDSTYCFPRAKTTTNSRRAEREAGLDCAHVAKSTARDILWRAHIFLAHDVADDPLCSGACSVNAELDGAGRAQLESRVNMEPADAASPGRPKLRRETPTAWNEWIGALGAHQSCAMARARPGLLALTVAN
jgi:hypothetical protein